MNIEHSGWREDIGFFSFKLPVDETKEDYEIRMKNGTVFRQNGPFQAVTRDWNCDGDVYTLFGAYFQCEGRGGEFFSVTDMVSLVVDDEAEIPGIPNPFKHPSLDDQIGRADNQYRHGETRPSTTRKIER